jgi:hypothetical protein
VDAQLPPADALLGAGRGDQLPARTADSRVATIQPTTYRL